MPPHIQRRVRIALSAMALLMLTPLTAAFALAGWRAVPREQCGWLDQDFCSDYGRYYWAFALLCLFMLAVALRLINRRPRERGEDVRNDAEG
jgi:hypothetical protein